MSSLDTDFTTPPFQGSRRARPRTIHACEPCRTHKIKCNGEKPCSACQRRNQDCIYGSRSLRRRKLRHSPLPAAQPPLEIRPKEQQPQEHDPSPAESLDEAVTLVDPMVQKKLAELKAGIGVRSSTSGAFQFFGPSAHLCFVQRAYQKIFCRGHNRQSVNRKPEVIESIQLWDLDKFIFQGGESAPPNGNDEVHFSKEMGDHFIATYFEMVHPFVPILDRLEIEEWWGNFWSPPGTRKGDTKERGLVFIVLAIGASISEPGEHLGVKKMEKWAHHFYTRASALFCVGQDPSVKQIQYFTLKAVYGWQLMKPNDSYIPLGTAARSAFALGLHRAQIVQGNTSTAHRLRTTFWSLYAHERLSALHTGRPSAFRDEHIDAPYPEDLLLPDDSGLSTIYLGTESDYIKAMAELGRLSERIAIEIYPPFSSSKPRQLSSLCRSIQECDKRLEILVQSVPSCLRFFDPTRPKGACCQEIQRAHFGLNFYLMRILIHRPILVLTALYSSKSQMRELVPACFNLQSSISTAISTSKRLIEMAWELCSERAPGVKHDGHVAFCVISACVTLLYDVVDPETTPLDARSTFEAVEKGIQCLDKMSHIGPTTGKELSLQLMQVAKETIPSTENPFGCDSSFMDAFPWLTEMLYQDTVVGGDSLPLDATVDVPMEGGTATMLGGSSGLYFMPDMTSDGFGTAAMPNNLS